MCETFNFQKHPYRAKCVQWTGNNASEVLALLATIPSIDSATLYRSKFIMVRHSEGINTLSIDCWAIRGEDGEARFYSDKKFPITYEAYK